MAEIIDVIHLAWIANFHVFSHWETYVVACMYVVVSFTPVVTGTIMEDRFPNIFGGTAALAAFILMIVVQLVAYPAMLFILSPIIFGISNDAHWNLPWLLISLEPGLYFQLLIAYVIALIGLSFLGLQFGGAANLVFGGITLTYALKFYGMTIYAALVTIDHVVFIPDLWSILGFCALVFLLFLVGLMVSAAVHWIIDSADGAILYPILLVFSFIPVFTYGAWIGHQAFVF